MIDSTDYEALLEQNREILARHAKHHDISDILEVDIGSRYRDRSAARAARQYVDEKYEIPKGVLFRVVSHRYSEDDINIELAFSLDIVPNAELITKYEFMLQDAAEKFGGETPGWEIAIKPK
jgi:hypothetical protein